MFCAAPFIVLEPRDRYVVNARMDGDTEETNSGRKRLPWMFQKSLPVVGLLHTLANTTKDVNIAMLGWERFYASVKKLEN